MRRHCQLSFPRLRASARLAPIVAATMCGGFYPAIGAELGKPHTGDATRPAAEDRSKPAGLRDLMVRLMSEAAARPAPGATHEATQWSRLNASQLDRLAAVCAPSTPGRIITALIGTESAGYPLALAINGASPRRYRPATLAQAEALAADFQARGLNFDIGLMQINSANLRGLHLTAGQALEPCANIRAGAQVFERGYAAAMARRSPTVPLLSAYAIYNSGDAVRGYTNGYANAVEAHFKPRS